MHRIRMQGSQSIALVGMLFLKLYYVPPVQWKLRSLWLFPGISYWVYRSTVMRESFLNRQMALYVFSLIWRKGYYGAYRTPDILRPFLFFFIFFSSFTYERKREKGVKYRGYGRHRSIPSVKLNWKHREPFACSRNFHAWLYIVTSVIQEQLQEPSLLAIVGYVNKSPNIE
jgi:hypothetical protein